MKKIQLINLEITNFKGISRYNFNPNGKSGTLYGANGTGKTSVLDSLSWLLFGHDSHHQTAFAIKPLDLTGDVENHGAVTAVTAQFSVDGAPLTLGRTYFEKWTARRDGDTLFDGHTGEYLVDGVSVKKSVYEEKVSELIKIDQFYLLSSCNGFCKLLPWKERRALLLSLWDGISDQDLLASQEQFLELAKACGRKNLLDFAKSLQAKQKQLSGATSTLPARMDECSQTIAHFGALDFQTLAEKRQDLGAQLQGLRARAVALEQGDLPLLRRRLQTLDGENQRFRNSQSGQDKAPGLRRQLAHAKGQQSRWGAMLAGAMERKTKWETTPKICPTCGKPLSPGDTVAGQQLALEATLDEIRDLENNLEESANLVRELEYTLENYRQPVIRDMEGYIRDRETLLVQISAMEQDTALGEVTLEIANLEEEVAKVDLELGKETALGYAKVRLIELQNQQQDYQDKLVEIQRLLGIYQDFLRYKVSFLEDSINAFFGRVRFKLFNQQVNGSLVECCEATVDGVPYDSLNTATQVEAALDIITALSCHWQVTVPLVVDNAESITHLPPMDTQVVQLQVHPDYGKLTWEGAI